jgi:membrane protease YdiL (CAAX protease family)
MDQVLPSLLQSLPVLGLGATAAAVLYWRRDLDPAVFDEVPPRRTGLALMDLFLGLWILLAAQFFLPPLLRLLLIPLPGGVVAPTLRDSAVTNLLGQCVTHVPIILFALWQAGREPQGVGEFGVISRRPGREIAAGLLALLAALPMVLASSTALLLLSRLVNLPAPTIGHAMLESLLESRDGVASALMIISAVHVAPILEELVYRGLVQSSLLAVLGPARRWTVIFLAAGLFAFIHGGVATWQVLPGLFILGIVLGWLYEKHRSLLPGIVLHMAFNWVNIGLAMWQGGAS